MSSEIHFWVNRGYMLKYSATFAPFSSQPLDGQHTMYGKIYHEGHQSGLVVSKLDLRWKGCGFLYCLIQNTRWKSCQSCARINSCTQFWFTYCRKIRKIKVDKWGTPKKYFKGMPWKCRAFHRFVQFSLLPHLSQKMTLNSKVVKSDS